MVLDNESRELHDIMFCQSLGRIKPPSSTTSSATSSCSSLKSRSKLNVGKYLNDDNGSLRQFLLSLEAEDSLENKKQNRYLRQSSFDLSELLAGGHSLERDTPVRSNSAARQGHFPRTSHSAPNSPFDTSKPNLKSILRSHSTGAKAASSTDARSTARSTARRGSASKSENGNRVTFHGVSVATLYGDGTMSPSAQQMHTLDCSRTSPVSIRDSWFHDPVAFPPKRNPPSEIDNLVKHILQKDCYVEVIDLPWTEIASNRTGLYSGIVNRDFRPHGAGLLKYRDIPNNNPKSSSKDDHKGSLKENIKHNFKGTTDESTVKELSGNWYNGSYISDDWKMTLKKNLLLIPPSSEKSSNPQDSQTSAPQQPYHHHSQQIPSTLPPTQSRILGDSPSPSQQMPKVQQRYALGDALASPNDIIIEKCKQKSIESVSLLKIHDFAFVKRTDGNWTYSILADRCYRPKAELSKKKDSQRQEDKEALCRSSMSVLRQVDGRDCDVYKKEDLEEVMMFVIGPCGKVKTIRKRLWGKFVRRVKDTTNDDHDCDASIESITSLENTYHSRRNKNNVEKKISNDTSPQQEPRKISTPKERIGRPSRKGSISGT